MRLLNTKKHTLEHFLGDARPPYAILSHTWGEGEILYEDIGTEGWKSDTRDGKAGASKVIGSCIQATTDGYDYIWIDTCCIDKSSSAELSEAINSMFQWYEESDVCYAYLADVGGGDEWPAQKAAKISDSKWFTRGWTLQELIAPQKVEFFDKTWNRLGNRDQMASLLSAITRIDKTVLARASHDPACYDGTSSMLEHQGCFSCGRGLSIQRLLSSFPVATRMSWAAERVTTRLEDQAYCLLGIFSVNMPLLYGEGRRSFLRLQEEILRTTSDQSIFAHNRGTLVGINSSDVISLLADDPEGFRPFGLLRFSDTPWGKQEDFVLANKVIGANLPLYQLERGCLAILDCVFGDDFASRPAIILDNLFQEGGGGKGVFARLSHPVLRVVQSQDPEYAAAIIDDDCSPAPTGTANWPLMHTAQTLLTMIAVIPIKVDKIRPAEEVSILRSRRLIQEEQFHPIPIRPVLRQATYAVRLSHPLFSNGLVRVPSSETGYRGIMAIDDGHSHGFFVAWFYDKYTGQTFCQVRTWESTLGSSFRPVTMDATGRPDFSPWELREQIQHCLGEENWFEGEHEKLVAGRMVTATLSLNRFLGQGVLELVVDVRQGYL